MPKKTEKNIYKKAKKLAWTACSLYIRTKYYKNGLIECYTCGHSNLITKTQAGHGIPGRTNAMLFMEEIIRPQCIACNMFRRGRYDIFTPKLIEELGIEEYRRLSRVANETVKFTVNELLEKEQYFLKKLWEIKNN
jgi:hypothetical protein